MSAPARSQDLADDEPFKLRTCQLPSVGHWPTVATTSNTETSLAAGKGTWEAGTTSKEGSRLATY